MNFGLITLLIVMFVGGFSMGYFAKYLISSMREEDLLHRIDTLSYQKHDLEEKVIKARRGDFV